MGEPERPGRPPRSALQRWELLRPHLHDGVPLPALAARTGVALRTLERWTAAYAAGSLAGLEPKPRADRGRHRLHPDLVMLIEGLALVRPPSSIATITRRAARAAGERGWAPASYWVVHAIVTGLDPGMVTLAQQGEAAYRDRFEIVWRRSAEHANDIWLADHTMLDILILDPAGHPARPWLTTVLDDHSRAVAGFLVFLGAPSAMNTALALHQAIWVKADPDWPVCGIPDVFHVDHGSDFTSEAFAAIAATLHFEVIHSQVARPQGRGKVERLFGSINTELLPDLPGHLQHGQMVRPPTLSLAQLSEHIEAFIVGDYQQRTHPEVGRSPHDAWIAAGWLPRMPASLEELDVLLLTVPKPRTVQRDGIHLFGQRYIAPTLAPYVGERVTVRYDPRDITEIRVFHHNEFLCTAVDEAHTGQTITYKDLQAARNARRRSLRGQINERIAVVADVLPEHVPGAQRPAAKPPERRPKPRLRTYLED